MSAGPREQTTEPLRDKIAATIREHRWGYVDDDGEGCTCCSTRIHYDNWPEHLADVLSLVLGLTEERRTLTDGWIQPFRNAGYISQGLKPPPAVITHESRWVSGWSVVGEC